MTDAALITAIGQHRDEDALAEMVARYGDYVRNACRLILRHNNHLDDAVSQVWQRVWRYAARFRRDCAVTSWLWRLAQNVARNILRWHLLRGRDQTVSMQHKCGDDMTMTVERYLAADAVASIEMRDDLRRVLAAIRDLPDSQRVPLEMVVVGYEYVEIAAEMGCAVGTIKSRVSRAREAVRCAVYS